MNRILLLLEHPVNRKLLAEVLQTRYEVVSAAPTSAALNGEFDLGIWTVPPLLRSGKRSRRAKGGRNRCFCPFCWSPRARTWAWRLVISGRRLMK